MKINKTILEKIENVPPAYVAIVGSRDFVDYGFFESKVKHILQNITAEIIIVSGGAKGCDSLAARYAKENNHSLIEFLPDWDGLGKKAGFVRNKEIIDQANMCIAFSLNDSPGTKSSIQLATQKRIPLRVITL